MVFKGQIYLDEMFDGQRIQELRYQVSTSLDQIGGLSTIFKNMCHMKFEV
jgi:hypothetical protein